MTVSNADLLKALEAHSAAVQAEIRSGFDRLVGAVDKLSEATKNSILMEDGSGIAARRKEG